MPEFGFRGLILVFFCWFVIGCCGAYNRACSGDGEYV